MLGGFALAADVHTAFDARGTMVEGRRARVAPVLTFAESRAHPQVVARGGAIEIGGVAQPAPAPRFARTPGAATRPPPERGSGGAEALADWGFDAEEIARLRAPQSR